MNEKSQGNEKTLWDGHSDHRVPELTGTVPAMLRDLDMGDKPDPESLHLPELDKEHTEPRASSRKKS